jgi:hypothetical protein
MSSPKKLVIAGLSATAVVASIGYAFAQSTDDTALANSNWNGAQNSAQDANAANAGPPAMPPDAVSAYNAEINAADTMADQSSTTTTTTTSSDYSTSSSSSSTAAPDSTSPWSASPSQGSSSQGDSSPLTSTDPSVASPSPGATQSSRDMTSNPANTDNPSMTTNSTASPSAASPSTTASPSSTATAQTETRIELNSPNEPQYNLASDPWLRGRNAQSASADAGSTDGSSGVTERAPRADRN